MQSPGPRIQVSSSPSLSDLQGGRLSLCNSQPLVSSETRTLCTMPCIAAVKGKELLKRESSQYHPNDKSTIPPERPPCAAACLYPESCSREIIHGILL